MGAYSKLSLAVSVNGGVVRGNAYMPSDHEAMTRTPLVITHGGPGGSCYGLEHSLLPLAERRPVIFYDQLGSHLSPADISEGLMVPERFAAEAASVIAHIGFEKVFFMGHSWGGVVALELAKAYPQVLSGLIFSSPLISTKTWIDDAHNLLATMPMDVQATIQKHQDAGTTDSQEYRDAEYEFLKQHYCRMDPWPEVLKEGHKLSNHALYQAMWGPSEFCCTGTLKDYDGTHFLPNIAVPTLITCGRFDEARPATMNRFARLIPDARVHVFDHSAHVPYVEETNTFIYVLNSFLDLHTLSFMSRARNILGNAVPRI